MGDDTLTIGDLQELDDGYFTLKVYYIYIYM